RECSELARRPARHWSLPDQTPFQRADPEVFVLDQQREPDLPSGGGPPTCVRSGKIREESPRRTSRIRLLIEDSLQREVSRMQDSRSTSLSPSQPPAREEGSREEVWLKLA